MIPTPRSRLGWAVVMAGLVGIGLLGDVSRAADESRATHVRKELYGRMPDGTEVDLYTLTNADGLEVKVMTLGATLTTVKTPDRNGRLDIVTLHKDSFDEYLRGHPLFGSVVGRYANRIAGARFVLDGVEHKLEANAGRHHIHGGGKNAGFQWLVWKAEPLGESSSAGVRLSLTSPGGQGGFPGTLRVTMVYKLTNGNELVMDYTATTDKPTHVNLTNHAYWNLAGADSGDVLGHVVEIHAAHSLVTDDLLIPTGELRAVKGTPLDFTMPATIGSRVGQMKRKHYDDCYVLSAPTPGQPAAAARVVERRSGRVMEVSTTQPGVQFYTGHPRGFCLETQHYPNSPNEPRSPSTLLRPGETYHEVTVYRFTVQ